jgi:GNAT superfamily N-acetyltransferase
MQDRIDIAVRALRGEDAEAAAALIRLAFARQSVATDPPASALRESGAAICATLAAPGAGGFAAWDGAAMAGCVVWQVAPPGVYLGRLAVHPDARGRGVAPRLVCAVEQVARGLGLWRVWLSTRLVLADNRRLFARLGFVETQLHAHPGYDRPTFVDMEKAV